MAMARPVVPMVAPRVTLSVRLGSQGAEQHPMCPSRALTMLHRQNGVRVAALARGLELISSDASRCVFVPFATLTGVRARHGCFGRMNLKLRLNGGTVAKLKGFATPEDLDHLRDRILRGMRRVKGNRKVLVVDHADQQPVDQRRASLSEEHVAPAPNPLPMVRTKSAPSADIDHHFISNSKDVRCHRNPKELLVRATGDVPPRPLRCPSLQLEDAVDFCLENISVFEFFNLFFANEARGSFNASDAQLTSISRWTPPDEESLQRRVIKGRVAVPTPMGGDNTSSLEQNQWIKKFPSPDSQSLVIECDGVAADVPMGGSFSSVEVWEVRQKGKGCRVTVRVGVNYYNRRFAPAKVIKSLIIRGAITGAEEFQRHAVAYVQKYFELAARDYPGAQTGSGAGGAKFAFVPECCFSSSSESTDAPADADGNSNVNSTSDAPDDKSKADLRDHESCVVDSFWW